MNDINNRFNFLVQTVNKYTFVGVPNGIKLVVGDLSDRDFKSISNAALYDFVDNTIKVNIEWVKANPDEFDSIIIHELRHSVQSRILSLVDNGTKVQDLNPAIKEWRKNRKNYISFSSSLSLKEQESYFLQPLELDAYAFSIAIMSKESLVPIFRLPPKAEFEITKLAKIILNKMLNN